jgi:putative ABC transport system permease protein
MVLRQGLTLTVAGIVVGIATAVFLARLITDLLYGISAVDPLTFVVIPAVLLAVAALAIYIPARRASRVDPVVALRIS